MLPRPTSTTAIVRFAKFAGPSARVASPEMRPDPGAAPSSRVRGGNHPYSPEWLTKSRLWFGLVIPGRSGSPLGLATNRGGTGRDLRHTLAEPP